MTAPVCPTHGTPLSPPKGKGFSWYCPQKQPDGSWCPYKVKAERQAPAPLPAQIVAPGAQGTTTTDEQIKAQIWMGVAKLFQGSGMPEDALAHAKSVYEWVVEGRRP